MDSVFQTIERLGILALKIIAFVIIAKLLLKILNWI